MPALFDFLEPGKDVSTMFVKLFLVFALVPLCELYLLLKIGHQIGALNTILVVIVTGLVGAALARMEGLKTMLRVKDTLNQGKVPTEELLDALLIFVAGLVLLTPGFLTDLAGVALLIPPSRSWIKDRLRKRLRHWTEQNRANIIVM
jgi:UPF0716 protein FxsA